MKASYYLEYLLLNRDSILLDLDEESDDLNYLFILDKHIEKLHAENILNDYKVYLLKNFYLLKATDINRNSYRMFSRICRSLMLHLPVEFSDLSWIARLVSKYKLSKPQVTDLYNYIKNRGGNVEVQERIY